MNKLAQVPYEKYQRLTQRDSLTGGSLVLRKDDPKLQSDTRPESIVPDRIKTYVHIFEKKYKFKIKLLNKK